MKKKNGFTLIELLAVIVILAIIALIAVPQILNILNKARLNAAKDSTYGIVKAAETYATNFMLENNGSLPIEAIEFECDNTGCNLKTNLTGYNVTGLNNLDFKGTKPTNGTIRISNNGRTIVAENLQINGFSCSYANDIVTCDKGDNINDNEDNEYVTDNLLVRYNYEDSSNTAGLLKDLSGNGYDGVINGATYTNDGLLFDGVDDYISIAEFNTANITWEVTFKSLVNTSKQQTIISTHEGGGCQIAQLPNNILAGDCNIGGSYQWLKVPMEQGVVYSASLTYDGEILNFYVNGELVGNYVDSNGIQAPVASVILSLGTDPTVDTTYNGTSFNYSGSIYSVRVYDRALSEDEIKHNYAIDSDRY